MRICFINRDTLRRFSQTYDGEKADVFIFGFQGIEEVNYEKELKGETSFFEDAALLSKKSGKLVVCGCVTNTRGHRRKSVVVAEKGKIIGVSDMLHVIDGEISCGAALRVYETKIGRMGIVVSDDLKFPEVIKALSLCGSDFIVCPYGVMTDSMPTVLLRASAYVYGTPIFFCANGYCMLADVGGKIAFASPQSPCYVDFENVKEYHLVESRHRGYYKPPLGEE